MSRPALFDFPLANLQLIEASAGTGKTWTIAGLFVRLILENQLSIEQILVVTYTKAATAELRERLRKRLAEMRDLFQQGLPEKPDPFTSEIWVQYGLDDTLRQQTLTRVVYALRGFDQAAIYTIHGFCQRVLADAALEAGVPFDQELITDDSDYLLELIADSWRQWAYAGHPSVVGWAADHKVTPYTILSDIRKWIGKPYLDFAHLPNVKMEACWAQYEHDYHALRDAWLVDEEAVRTLLFSGALNGNSYRTASMTSWLADLASFLSNPHAHLGSLPDKLDKLTPEALEKGTKKDKSPPAHPFFSLLESFLLAYSNVRQAVEVAYIEWLVILMKRCNTELPARKALQGVLSFDDLLNRLYESLDTSAASALIQKVNQQFKAALIDEFQDTDPIQYRIFHSLFASSGAPIFLVGDPKQAIYSFRGADIFTYLNARSDAVAHYTLDVNQRSDAALVSAVNHLFLRAKQPFAVDGIQFEDVSAKHQTSVFHTSDGLAPFCIAHIKKTDPEGKPISKGTANDWAANGCAAEIVKLLNASVDAFAIDGRAITGGDIAVLVPSHRQGQLVMDALAARQVPAVQQATASVFSTQEANDLRIVLQAIVNPQDHKVLRAALMTDYFALTPLQIDAFQQHHDQWEVRLNQFIRYQDLWKQRGFMPMARTWLDEEQLAYRLLAYQDGERRLTNLLHLFELLQTESMTSHGLESLLKWLNEQCLSAGSAQEEMQMRLESDAKRVKIVTIHASKGLEYPIVFCPFTWDGSKLDSKGFLMDRASGLAPTLHCFPDEGVRSAAALAQYSEKLRLLYVALTRAKHRCYVAWGAVSDAEYAALGWLLHANSDLMGETSSDRLQAHLDSVPIGNEATLTEQLNSLISEAEGQYSLVDWTGSESCYQRSKPVLPALNAATFQRYLKANWQMSSFTGLTRLVGETTIDQPDHDGVPLLIEEPALPSEDEISMFDFPRGARPGTFLHSLFEEIDFTQAAGEAQDKIIAELLAQNGYENTWLPVLRQLLTRTFAQPLTPTGGTLNRVANRQRLVEMEFTFPMPAFPMQQLAALLCHPAWNVPAPCQAAAKQLDFATVKGYLKGFIDLMCEIEGKYYVIDYKSNWLGRRESDYSQQALTHAIASEHYYLQYLLYSLAVHRYLKQRLPNYQYESHFGGVRYLFLRGTATGTPGCGVFVDRPHAGLIDAMDQLFSHQPAIVGVE